MKLTCLNAFLGLATIAAASLMVRPASAATLTLPGIDYSLTGYFNDNYDPHTCMINFYGEVVNDCADPQIAYYPLSFAKPGTKVLTIVSDIGYFQPGLSCTAYEISIAGGIDNTSTVNFTAAGQTQKLSIPLQTVTMIQFSCTIPPGAGIAAVTWTL